MAQTDLTQLKRRINIGLEAVENAMDAMDGAEESEDPRDIKESHIDAIREIAYTVDALKDALHTMKLFKSNLSHSRRTMRRRAYLAYARRMKRTSRTRRAMKRFY